MWAGGCSEGFSVPQKTWIQSQINKPVPGEGVCYEQPLLWMQFFPSVSICDFVFQVCFSTDLNFIKVSAETRKGLSSYLVPLWHKTPFQERNWTSFLWIPAEYFPCHMASTKDSPFLFWSKVGGGRGSWLAAQWEAAQQEAASLGKDERQLFYFKSQNHGTVTVDQERFLSQTLPGFCVQHSSSQREIQSSIDTAFRGLWEKQLQESLCEDLLTSQCSSFCDLLSSWFPFSSFSF